MTETKESPSPSLIDKVGMETPMEFSESTENAWIDVIQKMDKVYADLVHYQVELEQKNAELEEAQQFIRSVLESMTEVLVVCDVQGRILQVNQALEDLTGKPEADWLHRSFVELFGEESQPLAGEFAEKLGSDAIVDCEVNLQTLEGGSMPLAMNCSSRYDVKGRLMGMVLIGRPVGELRRAYEKLNKAHGDLKQTQEQLVHSEKMASLGRLVAGVAHELNNPISVVFGNMHALQRYGERINGYLSAVGDQLPVELNQKLREDFRIDRIESDMGPLIDGTMEGAERISNIVLDLRRYSGVQKEKPEPFDLGQVIQTAVHWVVKASREKLDIVCDLPADLQIVGRQGQVHQILINLLQNAIDVMEGQQNPKLVISCNKVQSRVSVTVRDAGPGIPKVDLKKIFDPFFTTKAVGKGTGLGLYISYGLARDMGGDLQADNHPQGGAIFTLQLPLNGVGDE
ncbi:MAG: ATP-binding protein [Candidatus Thiodiazotropha endolucinida]|nr:ATP-binding protein [Candidatus Thiodiazotropha taylori]MCW4319869.1 ATP-binding protein [Candidatus Thiodiazotropha taylori]